MLDADPRILDAAERLFRTRGYHSVELADIATESQVALPAVQSYFPDKASILEALLDLHSPRREIRHALTLLHSNSAESMVRETLARVAHIFEQNTSFVHLMVIDMQVNEGAYLETLFNDLAGEAAGFVNRLSAMPGVKPMSSIMLGRALAAVIIGFIATQYLAPQTIQYAMHIYPQKAWIDSVTDILLHGILKSE
jgi:AcrR family transcriptional regulator